MRICMVFYDMQELGGLEEYATSLAIGLKQRGHHVSAVSTAWVLPNNQYLLRLLDHHVTFITLPKWISYPASDWATKERILNTILWLTGPLILLIGSILALIRNQSWAQSRTSARNWLRGQLMMRFIGPDWRKPFVRLMLGFWRLVWRPNLIHVQGYTSNLLFVVDWAHKKIPIVYEEHQTPDARFDWWHGFQTSVNKAAVVVAVSEKSAEALRTVCNITRPIEVRSPLLADPLAFGRIESATPREIDGPVSVTTVARLSVAKGLNYLVEAIARVRAMHPATKFRVFGEGDLRDELLVQAELLGLDGRAIFVGSFTSREELTRIMNQTDIFVMSSILEGQPLALVEAMAYGCALVATSVGGIPELIRDGVNGLLCEPGDPVCLAQKINELIEDPSSRLRLGNAARRSYEQGPYQPAAVSDELISIYDKALGCQ